MKKVVLFLVLLLFPIFVYADEYEIKDIDLKITIDDEEWLVFTRDNVKNNEKLLELGADPNELYNLFITTDMYLDAIKGYDNSEFYEFYVSSFETSYDINNLTNYPDEKINNELKKDALNELKSSDPNVEINLVTINNLKYLEITMYYSDSEQYGVRYYTIINGRSYDYELLKDTKITYEDKDMTKRIIATSSVKIDPLYEKENDNNQKEIEKYNENNKKDVKDSLIRIAIYVFVGFVIVVIIKLSKNSKNSNQITNNFNNMNGYNNYSNNGYNYPGTNNYTNYNNGINNYGNNIPNNINNNPTNSVINNNDNSVNNMQNNTNNYNNNNQQ